MPRVEDALVYRQDGDYWTVKVIDVLDLPRHQALGFVVLLDSRTCRHQQIEDVRQSEIRRFEDWRRFWHLGR